MSSFIVAVIVAIAGVILYLVSTPPKPTEVGRLMFFAGLLVALLKFAGSVHIG